MNEGKGKKAARKLATVSTTYLRMGAPESITQDQFTVLFLEVLRDRSPGLVTGLTRRYSDLLFTRFTSSAHVNGKSDALLCFNALRNSYELKATAKTGTGRQCCFCGTKRQLNDVTLFKVADGRLVPSGTFILNKKYVVALRAYMICNRIEDAVLQSLEQVRGEMKERFLAYKEAQENSVSIAVARKNLMTEEQCQISLSKKKRALCEAYNHCFMILWMMAGSDVFAIH
jgi:hypothetical protein